MKDKITVRKIALALAVSLPPWAIIGYISNQNEPNTDTWINIFMGSFLLALLFYLLYPVKKESKLDILYVISKYILMHMPLLIFFSFIYEEYTIMLVGLGFFALSYVVKELGEFMRSD